MTDNNVHGSNDQLTLPEFCTIFHDIALSPSEIEFLNTLSSKGALKGDIGAISTVAINYKISKTNEQTAKLQADTAVKAEKATEEMARIQKEAVLRAEKTAQETEKHMNAIKWLTFILAIAALIQVGITFYTRFNIC
jgi:hypothetical protein